MKTCYFWATPSGPINLMKAEDMPPSHHSEGWYKKYCESHNHANPEQSYQADLQAAKESAVPITDQVMAIKKILYSLGISTESASIEDLKRWHIRADTIYGPFSLRHEIQEQCNAACLRFGSCTDPKKCCIKKVAILYDDTPEKEVSEDEGPNTWNEAFLLHLIDVTACFVMEQNMYLATPTRKELIQKARETFTLTRKQ